MQSTNAGADGLPVHHRTRHVVVRAIDELRCCCYRFDTDAASVEVVRGGTAGPSTAPGTTASVNVMSSLGQPELSRPAVEGHRVLSIQCSR
ncbi:hypothetical protein [Amycolatopsis sp. cmx-4-61]|uniref:hypothetical protein n=1 Tax=Amycolatopsis sp. cmx-4-61 TaxID=2790937 RepID=UPI00397E39B3